MKTTTPVQQKKAADISRQTEVPGLLEVTLDHMVDGCQIITPGFRYAYVNKVAARQGRKTKDELLGRTMMEVYPGVEQTKMFANLKLCLKNRRVYNMENEFQFPDGKKGLFELKIEPVPAGVLIFSTDISKRKEYEMRIKARSRQLEALSKVQGDTEHALLNVMDDLKRANDKIELEKIKDRAILDDIGEGLVAIDEKGKVIMMNKAAETLLEQKEAAFKGKKVTSLEMIDTEGRAVLSAKRPISIALRRGTTVGPSVGEYYYVKKNKQKFPLGIIVTPIVLDKKVVGAIEIFRDVTKEQEVDKAKSEFVSIASHQLRTPLGIAKWYLEAVKEEGYLEQLPKSGKEYLEEVYKSNERVLKVVRELLSVSRIDQGRVNDNPAQTDVARLARDVVREMLPLATSKKIKLELTAKETEPTNLYIDQLRLHEVIQNLTINALEYSLAGDKVTVAVEKKSHGVVVRVTDTGIGISQKDQKRLFTKFYRSEKAALQNPDGSGLGLYMVKSYVEDWGGSIGVRSQEDSGTTFTITLPSIKKRK